MRILFFSHYFPPEGNAPASRTYEHCKRWVAAGHQVTVITCAPNVPTGVVYDGYRNRLWPQREKIDGIDVVRTWTYVAANSGATHRILNYLSYLVSAVFTFLFFCRRPNVIIATSPQFFCGWAGVIASWLKWTPMILEIRDIWPESIITVGAMKNGLATRFLEFLEKWMYRSANHIVAVGNGYRDNILTKAKVDNRIDVITNGVDLDLFLPIDADQAFLQKYNLQNRFVCSYVGTIGMAHGLEIVVRAAATLKEQGRNDIVFCIVGDGANRQLLEEKIEAAELGDLVKLTGRLPKSEMPTVLASSHCLLIHLKKTDLFQTVIPSKIFEAMAMQRPLVMGVQGESAEIVRRSKSGIEIESDNDQELVSAVIRLCDDAEYYQSLCQAGRSFAGENYSRNVLAARYLEIIEAVAGRTSRKQDLAQ